MSYQIRDLHFNYPDKPELFRGTELDISSGETTIITGENGSGKSTLLKLLCGILRPGSGQILFEEKPVETAKPNPAISYFPQNPQSGVIGINPEDDWKIWQMAMPDQISAAELKSTAEALGPLWLRPWFKMSSGQARRTALGILPFLQETFWLLDEPFAGLDRQATAELKLILEQKQHSPQPGMLIVSHDLSLAEHFMARVIALDSLR